MTARTRGNGSKACARAQSSHAAGKQLVVKDGQVPLAEIFCLWVKHGYGVDESINLAIAGETLCGPRSRAIPFRMKGLGEALNDAWQSMLRAQADTNSGQSLERHAAQSNMISDMSQREERLAPAGLGPWST